MSFPVFNLVCGNISISICIFSIYMLILITDNSDKRFRVRVEFFIWCPSSALAPDHVWPLIFSSLT